MVSIMSKDLAPAPILWDTFEAILLFINVTIHHLKEGSEYDRELCARFIFEYRILQTFGRCFLYVGHKRDEVIENEQWCKRTGNVLERLRKCFEARMTLELDGKNQYQKVNSLKQGEEPDCGAEHAVGTAWTPPSQFYSGQKILLRQEEKDRGTFDKLWKQTRDCNNHLLQWAPLTMAAHPRHHRGFPNVQKGKDRPTMAHEDAVTLNLIPHLRIRCITNGYALRQRPLLLKGIELHGPKDSLGLTPGELVWTDSGTRRPILFEYKRLRRSNETERCFRGDSELIRLAYLLDEASRSSNLHSLKFKGMIDQFSSYKRLAFVFEYPENADKARSPISLNTLVTQNTPLPVSTRMHLAKTLTSTLAQLHAVNWTHKSVRSDSVVFFAASTSSKPKSPPKAKLPNYDYNNPYLTQFDYSLPLDTTTTYTTTNDVLYNLYRHPKRQGPPGGVFLRHHDLYSLGIVLLELGLWKTAAEIYSDALARDKYTDGAVELTPETLVPGTLRETFLEATKGQLVAEIGEAYASAVHWCLEERREEDDCKELGMFIMDKLVGSLDTEVERFEGRE
jgi:hypothetical protein